jgi:uncharacterized lipoprotein YddW (UPF0748 family)
MTPLLALLALAGPPAKSVAPVPAIPPGAPVASPTSTPEMRGLWVVRTALVSPEAVDAVVDQARQAGFNALFVQVRGRGDAFYSSRLVPRSLLLEKMPAAFDPLARLMRRARDRGLQVHAWVNVLLAAGFVGPMPRGHVAALHPDWLMVPQAAAAQALAAKPQARAALIRDAAPADSEGFYLSPSAPGVPAHLEAVVRELVRSYPVDGLHLDFIRYPGADYDYSQAALEGFRAPTEPGGVFRIAELLAGPANEPQRWAAYHRHRLTALTERLSRAARDERRGLVVSAAVVPDEAKAVAERYQDWPAWLAGGVVDALCPMAYTPDARLFRHQVEQARARAGPGRPIWAGVGAYRLSPGEVVDRVRAAREAGASGVVLFSHESLDEEGWARVRAEAFVPGAAAQTPAAYDVPAPPRTRSPR